MVKWADVVHARQLALLVLMRVLDDAQAIDPDSLDRWKMACGGQQAMGGRVSPMK